MRKHRALRLRGVESLEPRAVPAATVVGVTIPTGLPGISVTLPSQVPVDSPQVKAAFVAFDQSFLNAVDNVLLAPGPNGLVVPSANRAAFDAAIENSLDLLATALLQSLGNTSATSPAAAQISDAITGGGSNSLESQIQALSTEAIEVALPPIPNLVTVSESQTVVPLTVATAELVRPTLRPPVSSEDLATNLVADPTSAASSSSRAANDIRSAFNNFLNDYFKAVQGVLLAADANGQVDPQAHRAAFDARVNQALQSLDLRLSATIVHYPAASPLAPQVQSAIGGAGAASLKSRLSGLATPDGPQAAVVRDFTLGSTKAIARALSLISGDVTKLLNRP